MKINFHPKTFVLYFAVIFIVNVIVVYLWVLVFHGQGTVDLGLSFTMALAVSAALSFLKPK